MARDEDEQQHGDQIACSDTIIDTREKALNGSVTHTKAEELEYEYITGIKLWLVVASITVVCFLMMLDMSIVVTAIPRITSDFHSLSDVGWYGSAYLLASCALQPLAGKSYQQFSSKHTFLAFLGLFEIGSVLCGAAQSSIMLIIGRAVAGMGGSGLVNGALTILAAAVPIHKRPSFYINLPIGAVSAIFLLMINIPERLDKSCIDKLTVRSVLTKLDLTGFVLFASFAVMILLALEWGGTQYQWNSAMIIGLFCGGIGLLALFTAWEYRVGDGAMIPYSMARRRIVWCSCLVTGLFFGSLLVFTYYLPIYFQAVRGVSPALSGVYLLPGMLSQMVMALVSGVLVGKLGFYLPWSVLSGVLVAIAAGLISTFTPDTSTATWVGYQFLGGIGRGCGLQMPIVAIQNILSPDQISMGMSLVTFSQTFGGSIFLTLTQTIFGHGLDSGLQQYAPSVNVQTVITAGATAFRQAVEPGEIDGVVKAYNLAINHIFYLAVGTAVGVFIFSWGIGWHKIDKEKKKNNNNTPEA